MFENNINTKSNYKLNFKLTLFEIKTQVITRRVITIVNIKILSTTIISEWAGTLSTRIKHNNIIPINKLIANDVLSESPIGVN